MIQREIAVYDKKTEKLKFSIPLAIPDEILFSYYKECTKEDPCLYYCYDIYEGDVPFYKAYVPKDFEFDFEKDDYQLECCAV